MNTAKSGDTVRVHYTGKFGDGTVFDTSKNGGPLEFVLGGKHVIAGFERAVKGMSAGESKTVLIPSVEAYGPHNGDLVVKVPAPNFPKHIKPEMGLHLQIKQPDDSILNMLITKITEEEITLDANNPFAGKDLTFEIELLEIAKGAAQCGSSPAIIELGR